MCLILIQFLYNDQSGLVRDTKREKWYVLLRSFAPPPHPQWGRGRAWYSYPFFINGGSPDPFWRALRKKGLARQIR